MGLAIVITLVASAPLVAGYVPLPSCGASLRPLAQSALSHVSLSPMSMRHRGLGHAPGHFAARARGQGRKNVGLSCTAGSDDEIEYFDPSGGAGKDEKKSLGRVEELGLFPLGLVLNPGAAIPLHIFEMKYRNLFSKAWEGNKRFGIVMYNGEKNQWASVGTTAELARFQPLPDGKILTVSEGKQRFRVLKVTREGSALEYIKALVEYIDDVPSDGDLTLLEDEVWELLNDVLSLSNTLYGKSLDLKDSIKAIAPASAGLGGRQGGGGEEAGGGERKRSEEERLRLFSFAVSQVLDMPLEDQQLLLQTQDTAKRLSKQITLLHKAKSYLAAQLSLKNAFTFKAEEDDEDA